MTSEERKQQLKEIQSRSPFATGHQLLYRGVLQPFAVYEIPLDILIYNQYNGRIGSVVKSFEKQNHTLNPELSEDIALIEQFLWDSKEKSNAKTLDSLRSTGQIKFGIVTSDGVIIDGNRRASLMNRIRHDSNSSVEQKQRCEYFKAVILPDTATKRDILQLETSFQMGEDEKVDYNPIEKYLKCTDLEDANFTRDEIASFMGITKKEVDQYLEILDLMDQYLAFYEYDGMYTMAEGHEDSFQKLNIALKQYRAGVSNMWDFNEEDLNNLMGVAFDYIRFELNQSDIRDLFRKPSQNASSIFASKPRWEQFFERHQDIIANNPEKSVDECLRDVDGSDITPRLKARDDEWRKTVKHDFEDNFKIAQDEIDSQLKAASPVNLIRKAMGALNSVDGNSSGFQQHSQEILDRLNELICKATELKSFINE